MPETTSPRHSPQALVLVALALVAVVEVLDRLARRVAQLGGAEAVARVEAASATGGRGRRYHVYTAETLDDTLRALEERYSLSSAELVEAFERGELPAGLPRHVASVWASISGEAQRLRESRDHSDVFFDRMMLSAS